VEIDNDDSLIGNLDGVVEGALNAPGRLPVVLARGVELPLAIENWKLEMLLSGSV